MMKNLLPFASVAKKTTQLLSTVARLRLLFVMLLTLCSSVNMWGAEVTFDLTKASYNSSSQTEVVWTSTPVTMKIEKGSSSTNANNYLGGTNSNTRCYSGQVFSVSVSSGYELKTIVITSTSSSYIMPTSGWSNATATSYGSVVTVTANSGATVISVNPGGTKRLTKVEITYESSTPAVPCTVTFNAGSGTCDKESETETSAGAGVTLPTATIDCGDVAWTFAGWAEASVATETAEAPSNIYEEGDTYKPTSDITLYAVYQRTEEGEGSGGGDVSESVDFSENGYNNGEEVSSYEGTNFSVTFDKGTNSNAPKYYTSGTAIRVYGGGYFIVSSESTITKIVLTFGSSDGTNAITTDVNTYSNGTWTGSATSVKFTIGGTSSNRRIKIIEVTTTADGTTSTTYYHSTPECSTETLVSVLPKIMNFWQSIFGVSLGYLRDKTRYRHVPGGIVVVSLHHRCTKIDFHHINMSKITFAAEPLL